MNDNRGSFLIAHSIPWAVSTISLVFIILLNPQITMADQKQNHEALLSEIVSATVRIMRSHGYQMPDYRITNGGTDVPISGPPEKYAFLGYLKKSWLQEEPTIVLHFYEANHLPLEGRKELVSYLISFHAKQHGSFALSLRMMKDRYKKPQIVTPDAFLEMRLDRIEN